MFLRILFYIGIICAVMDIYHTITAPTLCDMILYLLVTILIITQLITYDCFKFYRKEIKDIIHKIYHK